MIFGRCIHTPVPNRHPPKPIQFALMGDCKTNILPLCGKIGSVEYIMSCCPRDLADGSFRWWHNHILWAITKASYSSVKICWKIGPIRSIIKFVKEQHNIISHQVCFLLLRIGSSLAHAPTPHHRDHIATRHLSVAKLSKAGPRARAHSAVGGADWGCTWL